MGDHLKKLKANAGYPALLAKSIRKDAEGVPHLDRGVSLFGHTKEALDMARYLLFEVPFGRQLYTHLGIWKHHRVNYKTFGLIIQLAVLLHDIGKATMVFQDMIWHKLAWVIDGRDLKKCPRPERQLWRHEAMSAWFVGHKLLRPWLLGIFKKQAGDKRAEECLLILQMAVLGHHLKRADKYVWKDADEGMKDVPFLQIYACFRDLADTIPGIPQFPSLFTNGEVIENPVFHMNSRSLATCLRRITTANPDQKATRLSMAVHWTLMMSDVLGSINPTAMADREGEGVGDDLRRHFTETLYPEMVGYKGRAFDFSKESIGKGGRYRRLFRKRKFKFLDRLPIDHPEAWAFLQKFRTENPDIWEGDLYTFQKKSWAAGLDELDATLYAGCGGGKTIAALFWASARPWLRLVFTTPTMATSTQLMVDYGNEDASTRHSRSWLDYTLLTTDDHDSLTFKRERDADAEIMHTLDLFREQNNDAVFCTSDQVLGVLANRRGSIMWLPYLLQSQIVFDEMDSYDKTMTGWYLRFLDWFPDIPTLHMSATMTDTQRRTLQKHLPGAADIQDITAPTVLCKRPSMWVPRYNFHLIEESEAAALALPGTLWIAQQVTRAQANAELLLAEHPNLINFHSRFRYKDRWALRKRMMDVFQEGADPTTIAVATQMAEISLDIYANRLISEIGPIYAMIQRLGRCNRGQDIKGSVDVFFYMPPQGYPYSMSPNRVGKDDPDKGWGKMFEPWHEWVKKLAGLNQAVSQAELMEAMQDAPYEALDPVVLLNSPEKYRLRDYRPTMVGLLEDDVKNPSDWYNNDYLLAHEIALPDSSKRTEGLEFKKYRYILTPDRFRYDDQLGLIELNKEDA